MMKNIVESLDTKNLNQVILKMWRIFTSYNVQKYVDDLVIMPA